MSGEQPTRLIIDFGGSSTTGICSRYGEDAFFFDFDYRDYPPTQTGLEAILGKLDLHPGSGVEIVVTGGRSRDLPDQLTIPSVKHVDEIQAIGCGGLKTSGLSEALVVSLGTGTAMVMARKNENASIVVTHVGGTGLGGGTLMGLGAMLCHVRSFAELESLVEKGDREQVDLLVRDIVGSGIGILPPDLTAANFGRIARNPEHSPRREDLAAGLLNLVGQSVARLAST
ncbi:MAG TPA: Fumble domain-containing protein, partial [bacterium]|nr:Fumble domain-containing protein [bacterium]